MIRRALNQKTARHLPFASFLDLARSLDCVGVEARNDLGRPFFDGIAPAEAGKMAGDRGLRLLGLSEVYPFNDWNDSRASEVQDLIDTAHSAGAETVNLIPRVDGLGTEDGTRQRILCDTIREIIPMLEGTNVIALIEPIGFAQSSLRRKSELVDAILATGGEGKIKLVHDTFQHAIAGETEVFATFTGLVHLSGISDPTPPLDETLDPHRILISPDDRCGSIEQVSRLLDGGYTGAFSFECTDSSVLDSATLELDIRASFKHVEANAFGRQ